MRQMCMGVIAASLAIAGCQKYDFEPVSPTTWVASRKYETVDAKHLKPNLWLLVDTSGSMSTADACSGTVCTTRIAALQAAMGTFLSDAGTVARMGLSFFPAGSACAAPNGAAGVAEDLPAPTADDVGTDSALQAKADLISARVQSVTVGGGTPTGASVAFVGSQPGLLDDADGRDDYILLLTDGVPNCNDANSNGLCGCKGPPSSCSTQQVAACRCTTADGCLSGFCAQGCLDQDATAAAIAAQARKGVQTIVVAFGADATGGNAAETLDAMARAGGAHLRGCPNGTDAECRDPADQCVVATGLCQRQYYKATNTAELVAALMDSTNRLPGPCEFSLSGQPSGQQYVAVLVNGQDVPPGSTTWTYSAGKVTFAEASSTCAGLKARDSNTSLEFRFVEKI